MIERVKARVENERGNSTIQDRAVGSWINGGYFHIKAFSPSIAFSEKRPLSSLN